MSDEFLAQSLPPITARPYTELNPGEGGSVMDETLVNIQDPNTQYPDQYPEVANYRHRQRTVVAGSTSNRVADVIGISGTYNDFGLVTRNIPYGSSVYLEDFSHFPSGRITTVIPNDTTIVSYTVPINFKFYFSGYTSSGDLPALYHMEITDLSLGVTQYFWNRTNPTNLNVNVEYKNIPLILPEGYTLRLKCKLLNPAFYGTTPPSADYEGVILGYLVPITTAAPTTTSTTTTTTPGP